MIRPVPANKRQEVEAMQAWEYFVAPLLPHNPGDILNTFGADGWELVGVVAQPTPQGGGISLVAYMKRPKS
jgi:hypothetical protein